MSLDLPKGKPAEARWAELSRKRRIDLLYRGRPPRDQEEAATVLAFARRLRQRGPLWVAVAALSAVVVVIALEMLRGHLTPGSFVTAGALGLGVALGFGIGSRIQARNLAERATANLGSGSGETREGHSG